IRDFHVTGVQTCLFRSDAVSGQWHAAITTPPTPRHRVLTALAGREVVGFLAFAPTQHTQLPDSAGTAPVEVLALEVAAAHTRQRSEERRVGKECRRRRW